jgi:NTP pyrophosphatase (non-canonical NTP hydrolase)
MHDLRIIKLRNIPNLKHLPGYNKSIQMDTNPNKEPEMVIEDASEIQAIDNIMAAFEDMVNLKKKDPRAIISELTPEKVDLLHMALGIGTEAGELQTTIKKHTMYNKPLDTKNLIEELGDLMFYIQGMIHTLGKYYPGLELEDILLQNIQKLNTRYKAGFTNEEAVARADKPEGE